MQRSNSRPRSRHHTAPAAAAGVLLCALAGCVIEAEPPVDPEPPGEPRQVRTSFAFQVGVSGPEYGMFLILDEDADMRGQFAGTITFNGDNRIMIIPTVASMDANGELEIPAAELSELYFYFAWTTLRLQLQDPDGDGVLESGTGRIAGGTPYGYADDFAAARDGFPAKALAFRNWSPSSEMAPWDSINVWFGQPVSSGESQRFRVLANGQEVPGKIELAQDSELHTSAVFTPDSFYPLGATVEVDLDGMTNALGVAVIMEHEPIQVQADPGSILSNLGFEQALAGWYTVGDASVMAGAGDQAPVEGAGMAALRTAALPESNSDSRLIGYLDVPMDATALDLSLALLTTEQELPQSIEMRLYHDLAEGGFEVLEVYEFDHAAAVFEPCDCEELGEDPPLTRRTGPVRHEIDLSALRGQRVFLEIQLQGEPFRAFGRFAVAPIPPPPPPVPAILLLDDLQIR